MYVTMFPCNECAKLIIQAGIKEVVFYEVLPEQRLCSELCNVGWWQFLITCDTFHNAGQEQDC